MGKSSDRIRWALGSAYDLFASLFVIHNADTTGLRRAWAAGVRNRLAARHRDLLQLIVPIVAVPVEFIQTLGDRPDAAALLGALRGLPDDRILSTLCDRDFTDCPVIARVMRDRRYTPADVQELLTADCGGAAKPEDADAAGELLGIFADAAGSGALLRSALAEYHQQFFQEEEHRIAGYLESAYESAQERASGRTAVDLVDDLSGGLRLESSAEASGLLLIPSFWAGPLVLFEMLRDGTWVILFSARPRDVSLIPGDPVPDSLTRVLQAVSDQSRLRILKLLGQSPRTQIEIARELRLRPPTITHHLRVLRLANLVRLTETADGEKRYDVRQSRLQEIGGDLTTFLGVG